MLDLDATADGIRELETLPYLQITLSPFEVLAVLGNLQLALSHPDNCDSSTNCVYEIARRLQAHLSTPTLQLIAQFGWYRTANDGR